MDFIDVLSSMVGYKGSFEDDVDCFGDGWDSI